MNSLEITHSTHSKKQRFLITCLCANIIALLFRVQLALSVDIWVCGLFMIISILKTFFSVIRNHTTPYENLISDHLIHIYLSYFIYLLRQESSWVGSNRMAFLRIIFKALVARWPTVEYKRRNFWGYIYTTLALCHFAIHYTNVSKYVMITGQTNQLSYKYPGNAWYMAPDAILQIWIILKPSMDK